jgi:cell division protein FtsL
MKALTPENTLVGTFIIVAFVTIVALISSTLRLEARMARLRSNADQVTESTRELQQQVAELEQRMDVIKLAMDGGRE